MNALQAAKAPAAINPAALAFQFVEELAREVSGGRIELPAFPDVAMRVRNALSDDNVSVEKIARVVSTEAGLAARVLALANSAALSRGGKHISDIKMAVNRIGHNNVRTAAMSFAITQLRRAAELKAIAKNLEELWHEATLAAALCRVVAARVQGVNADEAMLCGLLHNVGKIYVLASAQRHQELFADREALAGIMRDWHANVGKAIVENWGFSEDFAEAVGSHEDLERAVEGPGDLVDVLTVATLLAANIGKGAEVELNMHGVRAFSRLQLDAEKCAQIIDQCADEVASMRNALGD